jgi:hypothetical protein
VKALWRRLGPSFPVRFARARAVFWIALGVVSWPLGWMNSVALVWMASAYANAESGFATGAAFDDSELRNEIKAMRGDMARQFAELREALESRS